MESFLIYTPGRNGRCTPEVGGKAVTGLALAGLLACGFSLAACWPPDDLALLVCFVQVYSVSVYVQDGWPDPVFAHADVEHVDDSLA